ncbi:MAG TPA: calcium-binding protein [Anaerolineales bacterium]|nr:calcium-binding protein [Anaerolineales bacterium]
MRKQTKRNPGSANRSGFEIGQSVVVKPGAVDIDYGYDLSGWQGRVIENHYVDEQKNPCVTIAWDSLTLKQMSAEIIERSEEDGLDWSRMGLYASEVAPASPRDKNHQVEKVKVEIAEKHQMDHLGEQGRRIQKVLNSVSRRGALGAFKAWEKYLKANLTFPFEAEVSEWQERGPLRAGDRVSVLRIEIVDDHYGLIVALKAKHGRYDFPLCDLEVIPDTSPNCQPVDDYAVWFANR